MFTRDSAFNYCNVSPNEDSASCLLADVVRIDTEPAGTNLEPIFEAIIERAERLAMSVDKRFIGPVSFRAVLTCIARTIGQYWHSSIMLHFRHYFSTMKESDIDHILHVLDHDPVANQSRRDLANLLRRYRSYNTLSRRAFDLRMIHARKGKPIDEA